MSKQDRVIQMVNDFNNDEMEDLIEMFGNINRILKYFHKMGVIDMIDPFDGNISDYQLEILNYLLNVIDDEKTLKYCVAQLSDVVPTETGYYLNRTDREDLSVLFDDTGRDTTARDVAKSVLGEDNDMFDRWGNTTDDIYRDVVEELNPENIERLKQHMLDILTNWKIEVDDETPDLFNNYSEDGIFYLTPENVGDVIGDEESFMYLINNDYLDDLESDLANIHSNAYNNALESEMYNKVMGELETFFDVKSARWESIPLYGNTEKLVEHYQLPFNPNEVSKSIKKYVSERNLWGGGYNNGFNLDYLSTWLNMMDTLMDEGYEHRLDFRISDYPDYQLVDKYINEIFGDSI
jgi:hypothetical protein